MTTPILLTGGTGTLGRHIVPLLRAADRPVRVLSRRRHEPRDGVEFHTGDLLTGDGIEAAVRGTGTIVHCAGTDTGDEDETRALVRTASRSGTAHHLVYISVVGADRIPVASRLDRATLGYFASKRAAERIVADSGLPWTMLRATQFYDLVLRTLRRAVRMPVIPLPAGASFQPIEAGEVAARLVELCLGEPCGLVPAMAGPRVYEPAELVRGYLRARGKRRLVVPVRLPGGANQAVRGGACLAPDRAVGRRTWEDFLADRLATGAGA